MNTTNLQDVEETTDFKKIIVNASNQQNIVDTTNTKKVIVNATDQKDIVDTTDFKELNHSKKLPLGPNCLCTPKLLGNLLFDLLPHV